MRKLSLFLAAVLVLAACIGVNCSVAAEEAAFRPALVITKIVPDTKEGDDNGDRFEAMEIVNTSGAQLNLYEYGIGYCGSVTTSSKFGKIAELTPFLPGDFRDGSTWTISEMPTNPDTFVMEPGEIVVVWFFNATAWEDGMTMEDFRSFWNVPDSVRTVYFDGNSHPEMGGHDDNFSIKNTKTGTYGVIRLNDTLASRIEAGEATFDADSECYMTVDFPNAPFPERAVGNSILTGTYTGSRQLAFASYDQADSDTHFGAMTAAQKEAVKDLIPEPATPSDDPTAAPDDSTPSADDPTDPATTPSTAPSASASAPAGTAGTAGTPKAESSSSKFAPAGVIAIIVAAAVVLVAVVVIVIVIALKKKKKK